MKKKWKVILGSLIFVCIVTVIILNGLKPLPARLLEIHPQSIAKTFKEEGLVVAKEEYLIHTAYGGKVASLSVQEGQKVAAGDLLVVFDDSELRYQLEQLQGQYKSLKAQQEMEIKKISPERMKELYEAGAISQKEYEDALSTVESDYYPGQLEALNAQIELTRYMINEANLTSPAPGLVTALNIKEGMVLPPGSPVAGIIQKDGYDVEVYVLSEDTAGISENMPVTLIRDNKTQNVGFAGKVVKIAPTAEEKISALGLVEQRVKITVEPDIPKSLELKPGYSLYVEFTLDKQDDKLVVPKTALFTYQSSDALWVLRDGKAEIQTVTTGFENDREIVIETGLLENELVILNPQLEGLKTGKKVISE